MSNLKRFILTGTITSCIAITIALLTIFGAMNNRSAISKAKISSAHTLVFYRDNCRKCQQRYPAYYLKSVFDKSYVLVNVNNSTNGQLAEKYNVKKTPTIINKSRER
ncbi:hypothetical protein DT351_10995 (plasmid) [Latilactobacillus curvatus]|uniref:Thioredoxin domain-containing protein n=2 Tax=Latilactobacillus curvatus TaxID=28038 RepID=A0A385AH11_LATCU|nr:hypothetical protein DT351_10995 [Latilactobacillus curvatus]